MRKKHQNSNNYNEKFERKKNAIERKIKEQLQLKLGMMAANNFDENLEDYDIHLYESSSSDSISDGELSQFSEFAK